MPDPRLTLYPDQSARLGSSSGVPVREDTAYTNAKGREKGGIRKRTEKAIEKLQEPLRKVLEPEEAVLVVANARLPESLLEQFFLGWLGAVTDTGLLVLTNRRLLFFLVGRNGSWKRSVRGAVLGDIEEAKVKTFLARLDLRFRNSAKEAYWRIGGEDAKRLKAIFPPLLQASGGEQSSYQRSVHLCPQCLAPLTEGIYLCPKCGLEFKNEAALARRAWLLPGGGYFYARHPGAGVLDFGIEAIIALLVLSFSLQALGVIAEDVGPGETPLGPVGLWGVAGFLVLIWIGKKFMVIRHCRRFIREFIPTK